MSLKKLGIATLLLGICIALMAYVYYRDPISPRNCNRVQLGMTESEVEAIMGEPPDGRNRLPNVLYLLEPAPGENLEWESLWIGEAWLVMVHFDAEGKVCAKGFAMRNLRDAKAVGWLELRQRWGW